MPMPIYTMKQLEDIPRLQKPEWINDPAFPPLFWMQTGGQLELFFNVCKFFDLIEGKISEESVEGLEDTGMLAREDMGN